MRKSSHGTKDHMMRKSSHGTTNTKYFKKIILWSKIFASMRNSPHGTQKVRESHVMEHNMRKSAHGINESNNSKMISVFHSVI